MAQHKSAKKRIRTTARKNAVNRSYISTVRTAVKKLQTEAQKGADKGELSKLLSTAQSLLARAAKRGIIHKNTAARRTSRLTAFVQKVEGSAKK